MTKINFKNLYAFICVLIIIYTAASFSLNHFAFKAESDLMKMAHTEKMQALDSELKLSLSVISRPERAKIDRSECKKGLILAATKNPAIFDEINTENMRQEDKPILNRGSKWVFTCDREEQTLYLIHPDRTILNICTVSDKGICTNTETVFNQPPSCYKTLNQADGDFSKVCGIEKQLQGAK